MAVEEEEYRMYSTAKLLPPREQVGLPLAGISWVPIG